MNASHIIHPNVRVGTNVEIGHYVILGHPPIGSVSGELPLVIGDNCVIRSHTVIYAGGSLGSGVQTGHGVTIREHTTIGDDVSIGGGTAIEHHVTVGNNTRFHAHNLISEFTVIEDDCWIGPHACITNVLHPRCPKGKECVKGATIRRGAKVGGNTTLAPDIEIGEMALVGAGSVVLDDVAPRAVVVGNPAREVKQIGDLVCPYGLVDRPYE